MVTGASRGIGEAISDLLEDRGCSVIRAARNPGGGADDGWLELDISSDRSVGWAVEAFGRMHDRLDALINNAAILIDQGIEMEDLSGSTLLETLQVNVVGTHRVTNAFLPFLKASDEPRVINISSRAGQLNEPMEVAPAYCVSKTALNGLTSQQALALQRHGVSVNCMSPGWVRTGMGGDRAPLTPEQGADTAVWLALEADHGQTGKFWSERTEIPW